jgi:hypothetical protein
MDGDDDVEQRRLLCSGGASKGEARWHELWGHGGGVATGDATAGSWRRCEYGVAAAAREDGGSVEGRQQRGGEQRHVGKKI